VTSGGIGEGVFAVCLVRDSPLPDVARTRTQLWRDIWNWRRSRIRCGCCSVRRHPWAVSYGNFGTPEYSTVNRQHRRVACTLAGSVACVRGSSHVRARCV